MLNFLLGLLGLIPSGLKTLDGITAAISNEKIAAITATTDKERINAQERVETLQAQRDVLISDSQHSNLDVWMRTLIASGPTFILCKIFFYDKALGWGTTEIGTNDNLWTVIMVVLGFYFLSSTVRLFK
jgi:hypothetical protein